MRYGTIVTAFPISMDNSHRSFEKKYPQSTLAAHIYKPHLEI